MAARSEIVGLCQFWASHGQSHTAKRKGRGSSWNPEKVRVPLLCSAFSDTLEGSYREESRGRFHRRQPLPGVDFQIVRSRVSMAQVVELIGFVANKSSGDQLRGPCPIHGSSSPRSRSFSVNVQRHTYQCFKCGSLGNQLDLWAAVTKTDLHTAAIDLCDKAHVDIPWIRKW